MSGTYRRPITLRVAQVCGAAMFCIFCIPTVGSTWPIGLWDDPTAGGSVAGAVVTTARTNRPGGAAVSNDFVEDLTSRSGDLDLSGNTSATGGGGFLGIPNTDGAGTAFGIGGSYSGATRRGDGLSGGGDDLGGIATLASGLRDRFAGDQIAKFAALFDELRDKAKTANNQNQPDGRGRGWGEEQSGRSNSDGAGSRGSAGSVGGTGSVSGASVSGAANGLQVITVPEPASVTLLGAGLIGAAMLARRRDRRRSA